MVASAILNLFLLNIYLLHSVSVGGSKFTILRAPNAHELSRLRVGTTTFIIHQLCQQNMLKKCQRSKSARANC
jgi:hypothetical protein